MNKLNVLLPVSIFGIVIILSACSVHQPNYDVLPSVEAKEHYSLGANTVDFDPAPWWTTLNRPGLNELVTSALLNNLTIEQAVARIRRAQANNQVIKPNRLPKIDLQAEISKDWQDSNEQPSRRDIGVEFEWELDLFQRLQSTNNANELLIDARKEDLLALQLVLSAEIAEAYFGAVGEHLTLALLQRQLKTDQELQQLIQLRFDSGVGTKVELLQQQSRVAESKSLIPPTQHNLRVFENRLDVLLGEMPDGITRVAAAESLDFTDDLPQMQVPASLLLRRPDLRALRLELIAADADIGAAIADRLPNVTLEGNYLYRNADGISGPVSSVLGSFVLPLLNWGSKKAAVEHNKAVYQAGLANYTQRFLEAVENVENNLSLELTQRKFIDRLEERLQILNETVAETEALYTQGVTDYLPVLSALQELRTVERNIIVQRLSLIKSRIRLHRGLGGPIFEHQATPPGATSE